MISAKIFLQSPKAFNSVLPCQRDRTSLAVVVRVHGNNAFGPAWNRRRYYRTVPGPSDLSLDGLITKPPLAVRHQRRWAPRAKTADMWMRSPGVAFPLLQQCPSIEDLLRAVENECRILVNAGAWGKITGLHSYVSHTEISDRKTTRDILINYKEVLPA